VLCGVFVQEPGAAVFDDGFLGEDRAADSDPAHQRDV